MKSILCTDCQHKAKTLLDGLLARLAGHDKKAVDTRDRERIKQYTDAVLDIRNLLVDAAHHEGDA